MKTPDKVYWSYLAGMFDGEGTFSIYYQTQHDSTAIRIEITNTNLELMEWLVQNFGGQYYHHRRAKPQHKIAYGWRPKGRANSEQLLLGILPYLVIKKKQANIALQYIRLPHNNGFDASLAIKRKALLEEMQTLNKRGFSVETNMLDGVTPSGETLKRKPDLIGDDERDPVVTQEPEKMKEFFTRSSFIILKA